MPRKASTRTITLSVTLPSDIAAQADKVMQGDPGFMDRLVHYGLMRRSIYRYLREKSKVAGEERPR